MILITGGAGYIGSHLAVDLLNSGHEVVILDNLSRSDKSVINHIETITGKRPFFYRGCVSDTKLLDTIILTHHITHVYHLAGLKSVGESGRKPELYFENNINKSVVMFEHLIGKGIKNFIFSSSATVYASSDEPLTESSPLAPNSTYASTKLFVEKILEKMYSNDNSLNITILRYFNPIGQHSSGLLVDRGTDNLYPNITKAVESGIPFKIYGNEYKTPDGTAIRDYIDINLLVEYHKRFMDFKGFDIFNVGTGEGRSVLEIVEEIKSTKYPELEYEIVGKRSGDVARLVCSIDKLQSNL